ncbi:ABC transporter permease, partial [Pyxidicoccus sp. 3LFB2]
MTALRSWFRLFFLGGLLSYRAFFGVATPWLYLPTLLAVPLLQVLFYSYLGRHAGVADDAFFVVGSALQSCSVSSLVGMTATVAGERHLRTLPLLLSSPAPRLPMFLGRALPVTLDGCFVALFGLFAGAVLLDFSPPLASLPLLALTVFVAVASCTGLGLVLGALGLWARDMYLFTNLAGPVLLLLCGAVVPVDLLPEGLARLSHLLPLTHGHRRGRVRWWRARACRRSPARCFGRQASP